MSSLWRSLASLERRSMACCSSSSLVASLSRSRFFLRRSASSTLLVSDSSCSTVVTQSLILRAEVVLMPRAAAEATASVRTFIMSFFFFLFFSVSSTILSRSFCTSICFSSFLMRALASATLASESSTPSFLASERAWLTASISLAEIPSVLWALCWAARISEASEERISELFSSFLRSSMARLTRSRSSRPICSTSTSRSLRRRRSRSFMACSSSSRRRSC
mmetsp:Transcript_7557/g.21416  ORF Transcript_7557/g.21416 Transcript_7557/m.21416 type:complete len:222 (-) Transcript_7557:22-687(-)